MIRVEITYDEIISVKEYRAFLVDKLSSAGIPVASDNIADGVTHGTLTYYVDIGKRAAIYKWEDI